MAKFLNTQLLSEWIYRLINEAEREIILLVPYIQLSDKVINALKAANNRGVETLLIYRESKLSYFEREKILSISNLNLMHHPNLHAKCYMNENYLIIGSMNLYEFSEKNNREMGVLLHRNAIEEVVPKYGSFNTGDSDHDVIFEDAKQEIKLIVNSAKLERESSDTREGGFEFDIIKTKQELCLEYCDRINQFFIHKKFFPLKKGDNYLPFCKNFFDHLDLIIDYRSEFIFQYPKERINVIYEKFRPNYDEFLIQNFKLYWNKPSDPIYLYENTKSIAWSEISSKKEEYRKLYKNGFNDLFALLKQFI